MMITATQLWALRYPDTHDLYVLSRAAGGPSGRRHLEHASPAVTIRVRSAQLSQAPWVVVASERMDDDPGWSPLRSGELLHVDERLEVSRRIVLDHPPATLLSLDDLGHAAASQAP